MISPVQTVSFHYLFTLSLRNGVIPAQWKIHKIIPIFKSDDPSLVNNYRPISLLSNTSKVLERLVFDIIISHIGSIISLSPSMAL